MPEQLTLSWLIHLQVKSCCWFTKVNTKIQIRMKRFRILFGANTGKTAFATVCYFHPSLKKISSLCWPTCSDFQAVKFWWHLANASSSKPLYRFHLLRFLACRRCISRARAARNATRHSGWQRPGTLARWSTPPLPSNADLVRSHSVVQYTGVQGWPCPPQSLISSISCRF